MSSGHNRYDVKSDSELAKILGTGDTGELYARPYRTDYAHDIPYTGGASVDGKTVFIDQTAYREVMDGVIHVRGMTGRQIIAAWCEHEHTEWSVEMGDNPCDHYPPSHEFATAAEERFVGMLPVDPDRYEKCIEPGLDRCMKRFIKLGRKANPPRDLWCGPIADDPNKDDCKILAILKAKGVLDAFKLTKAVSKYGIGEEECRDCAHFCAGSGELRKCELVNGLVRANRWCDRWEERKGK